MLALAAGVFEGLAGFRRSPRGRAGRRWGGVAEAGQAEPRRRQRRARDRHWQQGRRAVRLLVKRGVRALRRSATGLKTQICAFLENSPIRQNSHLTKFPIYIYLTYIHMYICIYLPM